MTATARTDWTAELEARSANFLEILRLAQELGVGFAFPSTSVYVESTPDKPMQPHGDATLDELSEIASAFGPDGRLAQPFGPRFPRSWSPTAGQQRGEEAK